MNAESEYIEWSDANSIIHRDEIRKRVDGRFSIKFKLERDYAEFVGLIKESNKGANKVRMTVFVNNLNDYVTKNFFVHYRPTLFKNFRGGKCYKSFDFEIGEE